MFSFALLFNSFHVLCITLLPGNVEMSAVLSPSGWAWLVCGRRLLVWRYRQDDSRRLVNHQFRELTLPPSDLAHRAQLVVVFSTNEGQVRMSFTGQK